MIMPDSERVIDIVREIELIFNKTNAVYHETFPAALYLAVVSANEMGMDKESFLKNCETLFDSDKQHHFGKLQ